MDIIRRVRDTVRSVNRVRSFMGGANTSTSGT